MTTPQQTPDYVTSVGMGVLAFAGAISKGRQWRDKDTGRVDFSMLFAGVATALVLTAIVRAIGVKYGVETTAQFALCGVFGYIGPDPIMSAISNLLLKKFGVAGTKDDGNAGK